MIYEDFINILVSGLGIIVGVLIGYQVFQAINITGIKNSIKKERELFRIEKNEIKSVLFLEIAKTYEDRNIFKRHYYILKSIGNALEANDLSILDEIETYLNQNPLPMYGVNTEMALQIKNAENEIPVKKLKRSNYKEIESILAKY